MKRLRKLLSPPLGFISSPNCRGSPISIPRTAAFRLSISTSDSMYSHRPSSLNLFSLLPRGATNLLISPAKTLAGHSPSLLSPCTVGFHLTAQPSAMSPCLQSPAAYLFRLPVLPNHFICVSGRALPVFCSNCIYVSVSPTNGEKLRSQGPYLPRFTILAI